MKAHDAMKAMLVTLGQNPLAYLNGPAYEQQSGSSPKATAQKVAEP